MFLCAFASHLSLLWLLDSTKRSTDLCFMEKLFLQSLYKVVVCVSETNPLIIYLMDVEKLLESERFYKLFQILLNKDLWSCLDSCLKSISTWRWYPRSSWRGLCSLSLQHRNQTTWGWISALELEESLRRWHEDGSVSRQQEPKYPSWTSMAQYHCIFAGMYACVHV